MKIIAIGGGGFTHETFPELDDFCLQQTGRRRPRIAYIGTASRDNATKIARFKSRFADVSEAQIHLPMSLTATDLARRLDDFDLIYVGGGNTEAMVNTWRANEWDRVLGDACRSGVALAGVSAGAVCWFDAFLFSSGQGPMRPLDGLGLIPMGACPHYSTETDRRAALHKAVAAGDMPTTLAIDDGVAVAFDNAHPVAICSAVPGAGAYCVSQTATGTTETPLSLV
ncbi:MAG: peptidase E [Marinibacterium sp.]|jgi:dipeptidase E|nr:peptidase E [Marinibacterium sp.]